MDTVNNFQKVLKSMGSSVVELLFTEREDMKHLQTWVMVIAMILGFLHGMSYSYAAERDSLVNDRGNDRALRDARRDRKDIRRDARRDRRDIRLDAHRDHDGRRDNRRSIDRRTDRRQSSNDQIDRSLDQDYYLADRRDPSDRKKKGDWITDQAAEPQDVDLDELDLDEVTDLGDDNSFLGATSAAF